MKIIPIGWHNAAGPQIKPALHELYLPVHRASVATGIFDFLQKRFPHKLTERRVPTCGQMLGLLYQVLGKRESDISPLHYNLLLSYSYGMLSHNYVTPQGVIFKTIGFMIGCIARVDGRHEMVEDTDLMTGTRVRTYGKGF
jgi:hypothetical protein